MHNPNINYNNFHCPICGEWIESGTPKHICPKDILEDINKLSHTEDYDLDLESGEIGDMLTYAEMLLNFQEDTWDIDEEL